ncbi:helix-turn-helix transcriptional regulator [Promicromonospora sukumoe]|uniref:helix-turn-helix transcriptional regulator n=1 Tax=Promicromonospora sukumoe TaxID=88382 RepID=UPI00037A5F81|nr:LuxR family transcriptional regulator [Promicromonospora sukumoe]
MTMAPDDLEGGAGADRTSSRLIGRDAECARLAQLLTDVSEGDASALCLYGRRGTGKSALLEETVRHAGDFRVLRVRGVETERDLPYAGLHQLCAPLMSEAHALDPRQLAALDAAFGESAVQPVDRFLVGLAVLNLLGQISVARPVCCVVDDAHLLDVASLLVLAFVARRPKGGARLILFSEDEQYRRAELEDLPEMHLGPITPDDARLALATAAPHGTDPEIIERILLEARGNARALTDAFAGTTAADLAGGFAVPPPRADGGGADPQALRDLQRLPDVARRLLLVAASEPTGNPTSVWRAAATLGISVGATVEAEDLLVFGPRVLFRHPHLRATVYAAAALPERRAVHRALAEATTSASEVDRRTWHQALATSGLDDRVAEQLERDAPAARARAGLAAHAAFLERSAMLSTDPRDRARRALTAATAKQLVGDTESALRLLTVAQIAAPDPSRAAQITLQRARIAFAVRRDSSAPALLLDAAEHLSRHRPYMARPAYLEALVASAATGRLATTPTPSEVARTVRLKVEEGSTEPVDLLLEALASRLLDGYRSAVPLLREAVGAVCSRQGDPAVGDWLWLAGFMAADLWDERAWDAVCAGCEQYASVAGHRARAGFQRPDHVLAQRALADLYRGRFERATTTLTGAGGANRDGAVAPVLTPSVLIAAWRGRADLLGARAPTARRYARDRGDERGLAAVALAEAILYNGLGHYGRAVVAVRDAVDSDQLVLAGWALPELVEAATRSRQREEAVAALVRLRDRTGTVGTDWGSGVHAMSAALLADDLAAEELYEEAVDRLSRTGMRVHLGRAQLVYGEWLRRQNRRVEARELLRGATDLFETIGADAFAGRARRELLATSEKARPRRPGTARTLTPQEYRIAHLARDGRTNPQIGAELFISPRTVEYHLGNVFTKLAITSRTELHLVLDRAAASVSGRHATGT